MKRFIAMTLALVMLSLGFSAMAEGFTFRNGVTWGMTPEQVQEVEDGEFTITDSVSDAGIKRVFMEKQGVEAAGAKANLEYLFYEDKLMVCVYMFETEEMSLEKIQAALEAKYGETTEVDVEAINATLETIGATIMDDESSAWWSLEDGTLIWATGAYGDIEVNYIDLPDLQALELPPVEEEAINTDGL